MTGSTSHELDIPRRRMNNGINIQTLQIRGPFQYINLIEDVKDCSSYLNSTKNCTNLPDGYSSVVVTNDVAKI